MRETRLWIPVRNAGWRRRGNTVDSSLNPDANVSSGLANHPYPLGDLQNLLESEGRKGSLYTIHSVLVAKDGLGFHMGPARPSCRRNFFPTEQL